MADKNNSTTSTRHSLQAAWNTTPQSDAQDRFPEEWTYLEVDQTPTHETILVVDDNPVNLKILYNTLIKGGYRVVPAQDAQSALARLQLVNPSLILLDIMMPEMNGFELYERIRKLDNAVDIPIMFISALSDTQTIEQGFALGAVDYITKPFRAVEVLGRVSTHIRLKSLQDTLIKTNLKLQSLLNRHQCILNGVGDGIFGVEADGKLVFINQRALQQLGYNYSDLTAANIHETIHHRKSVTESHNPDECPILSVAKRGSSRLVGVDKFYHRDGHYLPVEFTVSGLMDANQLPMAVVLFRDITERLQTELRLKEAAAVFEVSCEGIFLTDAAGVIQRVNPAFSNVTGYQAADVVGQNPRILKSGRHDQEFYATMWEHLINKCYWEGEIWNRRKDGSVYPEWEMITVIRDSQNQNIGYVAQFSDITRRKLTEDELRYRGNYDVLTGLVNRSLMMERLDQAIKEHRRRKRKLGVLFIDLDRFKPVNDTLGHHIGDLLLQQVAVRIQGALREIDTAARLGGDEFVVLLMDLTNRELVAVVADRLLEAMGHPFNLAGHEVPIGVSIGVSMFPDDGDRLEVLLQRADYAMYRAKDCGRHQVQFFTNTTVDEQDSTSTDEGFVA